MGTNIILQIVGDIGTASRGVFRNQAGGANPGEGMIPPKIKKCSKLGSDLLFLLIFHFSPFSFHLFFRFPFFRFLYSFLKVRRGGGIEPQNLGETCPHYPPQNLRTHLIQGGIGLWYGLLI